MINIRYFASLKDRLQRASEEIELPSQVDDVDSLIAFLRQREGIWKQVFPTDGNVLFALNQEMAKLDSKVKDGDEIGFFPPVTGG